ncbi:MAG TPA: D-glucuronyl C5-epimerase family protein, partial [Solirubrobacteraceae bacterium]|nr:D-glucuronyl C5-epimerase family protein [Solirubrobacteraceae bacterium]
AQYNAYLNAYIAAKHSLAHLSGTRHTELGAVLANVQAIAGSGLFIPTRLPALFLTLERNRHWWTTEPLLSSGERVSFPPSKLVWEYYPGQGIEIQWLGTFGEGNGYYLSGHENANLRQLVKEIIPLATSRAGGIAWEYLFHFDGGSPPWTSGLSQGTALQVLTRAGQRFREPAYLTAAKEALGIFKTAPPQGVRVKTKAGAMYAEYTYAPSDHILNGFIQAVVGLYDYTSITKDTAGLSLFEAGDAEARAEVPHYDTGAWSLYDQYGESNLNYHELLTEFLQHLCERTRKGPPLSSEAPPPATVPAPAPPSPTGGTGTGSSGSTGTTGTPVANASATASTQIQGDEIYCTTAESFKEDLATPPAVSILSTHFNAGSRAGVALSLSKISTVHMIVRKGSRTVWSNGATLARGRPRLLWITPKGGGTYTITITATDLAGNFATSNATVQVSRH